MSDEEQTLADIRAHIGTLPADVALQIIHCADAYRAVLRLAPTAGAAALALIGAELAVQS